MKKRILQITIYFLMTGFVSGQTVEIDPLFGEEGFLIFENQTIHEIEVQTNGKIIVLGDGIVYGFDINGKTDTTFADNGVLNNFVDTTTCFAPNEMALLFDDNHIVFLSPCADSMLHLITYDIQNDTIWHFLETTEYLYLIMIALSPCIMVIPIYIPEDALTL